MAVVAALLLVVAVALAVLAVAQTRRARARMADLAEARRRVQALETELAAAAADMAAETARADAAERALAAATEGRHVAEKQLIAESEARERAEAAAALDVDRLWDMELRRSSRTWRWSVAPDPLGTAPLDAAEDPLRTAVEIEASAWREDSGTHVEIVWDVPADLPPAARLMALRQVQEELADVAKGADQAVVHARLDGDDVRIDVRPRDTG